MLVIDFGHGRASDDSLRSVRPTERELFSKGKIKIGSNVWVGEGVTIYAGAVIPDGAIVPAHSFVGKDFNQYA